jgi:hypothetical protein
MLHACNVQESVQSAEVALTLYQLVYNSLYSLLYNRLNERLHYTAYSCITGYTCPLTRCQPSVSPVPPLYPGCGLDVGGCMNSTSLNVAVEQLTANMYVFIIQPVVPTRFDKHGFTTGYLT